MQLCYVRNMLIGWASVKPHRLLQSNSAPLLLLSPIDPRVLRLTPPQDSQDTLWAVNTAQLTVSLIILLVSVLTLQTKSCRIWASQHSINFNTCWCDSEFTCLKIGEISERCYWFHSCYDTVRAGSWRKSDLKWSISAYIELLILDLWAFHSTVNNLIIESPFEHTKN